MDIFGNDTDYKLQRGMLRPPLQHPLAKDKIPAAQWSYAREGNPQVPEHEMGSSDPTQTTGPQNSNADNDRNGTLHNGISQVKAALANTHRRRSRKVAIVNGHAQAITWKQWISYGDSH